MSAADALADPAERERRRAMVSAPHMAPLMRFTETLARPEVAVPLPDPLDGGLRAQVLFLFEKPGPQAAATGFISRDNPDPTARAIRRFMEEAAIPREATLIWNVVPWWNGRIKLRSAEISAGTDALVRLIALMGQLKCVVAVGRRAEVALRRYPALPLPLFASAHPSAKVRALYPDKWKRIGPVWAAAWDAARS